jgi:hypothetical protein
LMPRAVDVLEVTHHHRIARHALVDDGATARPARAQRTALVRTVVRDGIERAVDGVDPDARPSDRAASPKPSPIAEVAAARSSRRTRWLGRSLVSRQNARHHGRC